MDKVCRNFISYSFVWAARRLHIFHLPFSFLRVVDVPFPTHSDFWSKCFPKQILIPVANLTVIISLIRISSCFVCIELLSEQLEKGWKKKNQIERKRNKNCCIWSGCGDSSTLIAIMVEEMMMTKMILMMMMMMYSITHAALPIQAYFSIPIYYLGETNYVLVTCNYVRACVRVRARIGYSRKRLLILYRRRNCMLGLFFFSFCPQDVAVDALRSFAFH